METVNDFANRILSDTNYFYSILDRAIRVNDFDIIKYLINNRQNIQIDHPDERFSHIGHILFAATEANRIDIVNWMIELGATVHYRDPGGYTAIYHASNVEMATLLLNHGSVRYLYKHSSNPLGRAVSMDNIPLLDLYLKYIDIDKQVEVHDEYLKYAIEWDHVESVKYFLEKGTSIEKYHCGDVYLYSMSDGKKKKRISDNKQIIKLITEYKNIPVTKGVYDLDQRIDE